MYSSCPPFVVVLGPWGHRKQTFAFPHRLRWEQAHLSRYIPPCRLFPHLFAFVSALPPATSGSIDTTSIAAGELSTLRAPQRSS